MRTVDRMIDLVSWPVPLRTVVVRKLLRRFPIGSYEARLRSGGVHRPNSGFCAYYAALEAKALGYPAVTVLELGVAGGNGLVCLCQHRKEIQKALGIEVVVVGFDAKSGLPDNRDLRDVQYFWPAGSFKMDRSALEKRIDGKAQLVLGENIGNSTELESTSRRSARRGAV
jgi:hypothetical protein